ncbi:MAG: GGDEF domain-containing protein [Solirubrobacteraceae bacterium]|nr:GGDEF domain-containing protein [Solirubrobacteraceae bacterium]
MGSSEIKRRLRMDPSDALGQAKMDVAFAAQVAMGMYLGAAACSIAMVIVPFSPVQNTTACAVLGVLSLIGALAWFVVFDRAPIWFVYVGMAFGTAIITAGAHYTGQAETQGLLLFIWGVIYAFVFFRFKIALIYLGLACVGDAFALYLGDPSFGWLGTWVTTSLTLLCVGVVVGALRARLAQALRETEVQALTDELTGLPNRRQLIRDLGAACANPDPHVLVLFDLNGFKRFNDERGHLEGDALLQRLGARLTETLHQNGSAYRLGGDEFCLLLDGDGELATPRAVAALSEDDGHLHVTAAHGFVDVPGEAKTPVDALRIADQRMYKDKQLSHQLLAERRTAG